MAIAPHPRTLRRYGSILVLLALRNELRDRQAPRWRRERNRIEIDRAIAELARERESSPELFSSSRVESRGTARNT